LLQVLTNNLRSVFASITFSPPIIYRIWGKKVRIRDKICYCNWVFEYFFYLIWNFFLNAIFGIMFELLWIGYFNRLLFFQKWCKKSYFRSFLQKISNDYSIWNSHIVELKYLKQKMALAAFNWWINFCFSRITILNFCVLLQIIYMRKLLTNNCS